VERPGYVPPAWLTAPATPGRARPLSVPVGSLDATIEVTLWSADDDSDSVPLPLVVVHDGPEYDERAALTRYLAAGITGGWLPRLRAALLSPGVHRNHWYTANPDYTDAVSSAVIPALADAAASTARVGIGTSLGGLAMLHIQRTHPDVFDALYLQSGSFFRPSFDAHERRRLSQYGRIVRFVGDVLRTTAARPVRTVLTCGAAEENVHGRHATGTGVHRARREQPRPDGRAPRVAAEVHEHRAAQSEQGV
jgi:enterochelin esterase family protein